MMSYTTLLRRNSYDKRAHPLTVILNFFCHLLLIDFVHAGPFFPEAVTLLTGIRKNASGHTLIKFPHFPIVGLSVNIQILQF